MIKLFYTSKILFLCINFWRKKRLSVKKKSHLHKNRTRVYFHTHLSSLLYLLIEIYFYLYMRSGHPADTKNAPSPHLPSFVFVFFLSLIMRGQGSISQRGGVKISSSPGGNSLAERGQEKRRRRRLPCGVPELQPAEPLAAGSCRSLESIGSDP